MVLVFSQGEILGTTIIMCTLYIHIIYILTATEGENRIRNRKGRKEMAEKMTYLQSLEERKIG